MSRSCCVPRAGERIPSRPRRRAVGGMEEIAMLEEIVMLEEITTLEEIATVETITRLEKIDLHRVDPSVRPINQAFRRSWVGWRPRDQVANTSRTYGSRAVSS